MTNKPLLDAATQGDLPTLKEFILSGADVNAVNSFNESLLFLAARHNHIGAVLFLLEKSANIAISNTGNQNSLHAACIGGNAEIVKALIRAGIDQNQLTSSKKSPFFFAVKYNQLEIIQYFISNKLVDESIFDTLQFSSTQKSSQIKNILDVIFKYYPALNAAMIQRFFAKFINTNNIAGLDYMLTRFPDLKLELPEFFSVIFTAITSNTEKEIPRLQASKIKSATLKSHAADIFGFKVVNPVLKHLMSRHGLVFDAHDKNGQTLLHHAAAYQNNEYEDLSLVSYLLEMKHPIDLLNKKGQSPLHFAILNGMFFHAIYLIYHGANVNLPDSQGRTPLEYAKVFCLYGDDKDNKYSIQLKNDLIQILRDYGNH